MRTGHLVRWGEVLQVPLYLIHHLVGLDVLKHAPKVRLTVVPEAEDALCGLAYQREAAFDIPSRVTQRRWRLRRWVGQPWSGAVPTLLSAA